MPIETIPEAYLQNSIHIDENLVLVCWIVLIVLSLILLKWAFGPCGSGR